MDNQRLFQLLNGTASHDRLSFTQLYQEFSPVVYGIALSVLGQEQDSADVVQDVFLRLWQLPPQSFPSVNPGAWLYIVTRRQALDLRAGRRAVPLGDVPSLPQLFPPQEDPQADQRFRELVEPLEPLARQIVTLKLKAGLTHQEIASLLGKKPSTVRWIYAKSLHALKLFWGNLLGALVCLGLGLWQLLPLSPAEGGITNIPPQLGERLPGLLLVLAGVVLLGCAGAWARTRWGKKRKNSPTK